MFSHIFFLRLNNNCQKPRSATVDPLSQGMQRPPVEDILSNQLNWTVVWYLCPSTVHTEMPHFVALSLTSSFFCSEMHRI